MRPAYSGRSPGLPHRTAPGALRNGGRFINWHDSCMGVKMHTEVFITIELDPLLSAAIAADGFAGKTSGDLQHVLNDIQRVAQAAILRGDAFAEEYIDDVLRRF